MANAPHPSSSSSTLPPAGNATTTSISIATNPHARSHPHTAIHKPAAASPSPLAPPLVHSQHQLYSPPNSVSSISTYSPSSTAESPSGHHSRHHQNQQQHSRSHQRQSSSYSHPSYHHDPYQSSVPADSSPRTFSGSTYDQEKYPHQPLSPSSFTQPSPLRHRYQLHQSYPTTTSATYPSIYYDHRQGYETPPPSSVMHDSSNSDISSNLPEYSYPMTPSQRPHRDLHRAIHQHHYQPQQYRQQQPQQEQEGGINGQTIHGTQDRHFELQQQEQYLKQQSQPQNRLPPPIRTKWSDDRVARECPPLTFQTGSIPSVGTRSSDWMSPATPRSTQIHGSILRQSSSDQYTIVDSPIDYREPRGLHHTISTVLRKKYDREDHDMEHCSEQDDIREREYGANAAEEVDENDALIAAQGKRQRLSASDAALQSFGHQLSLSTSPPTYKKTQVDAIKPGSERVDRVNGRGEREEDEEEEEGRSTLASTSSSRKQSVASSLQGDDRPGSKGKKTKATAPKRLSRNSPLQASAGDAIDQLDDDGQVGAGIQSLAGRGLRIYAQRVCERVETKGSTSYNELVQELVGGKGGENAEEVTEVPGQENIRRRVYDALNVLEALDIISFDNKDIRWVGIEESRVVQAVTRRSTAAAEAQDRQPTRDGDDESEEPEDDDMEIEKLQKEVDAMKLRNELVQAQLQDQVTRHVQVLNLVKRNKRREAKEHEREERRRQRKEERRTRAFLADQDPSMTDVGPQSSSDLCEEPRRKSERHRRRRSPRMGSEKPDIPGRETGGHEAEEEMEDEDEEARQKRKQERRERRERKERRAQRRLEKEKEQDRIQLPFVVVRMPGYACQSSDSEASISVVRRVRDDQKSRKSGKSKRQCDSTGDETTMVEIQIPQQEDVSIISDTEILGDLGFNTVALDELQTMLPPNLMATVQYAVSMEDEQHHPIDSSQRASGCSRDVSSPSDGDSMMDLDATSALTNVTVRGGFEREIVRAASEGVSSTV